MSTAKLRHAVRTAWLTGTDNFRQFYDRELFEVLGITMFQDLYLKRDSDTWTEVTDAKHPDDTADTYPMPEHGWLCFHCGEHFPGTDKGLRQAERHFSNAPSLPPECLDANSPARKLARRARVAEAQAERYRRERDDANELCGAAEVRLADLKRKYGWSSTHNALMEFDSLQGRALVAELMVKYFEARYPGVVAKARREIEQFYPEEPPK